MDDNGGGFFTIFVYNEVKSVIYRFPAGSEAEAILETIDLILYKTEKREEPWINGTITLANDIGIIQLNIPEHWEANNE